MEHFLYSSSSGLTWQTMKYWPSDSEVNTVGRGLRFSCNDRKVEVIKLFIIWHQQQKWSEKAKPGAAEVIMTSGCARFSVHSSFPTAQIKWTDASFDLKQSLFSSQIIIAVKRSYRMLGSRYNKENSVNIFENQRPKSIRKEKCQRPPGKYTQKSALFRMFSLRHHSRWQIDVFCVILEWPLWGHWRFETGNQKCCWYLLLQKPLGCSHLIFLDVDLNLLVLERGNMLMTTAVLMTLRPSIALWMFDYPANGMNLQDLAN